MQRVAFKYPKLLVDNPEKYLIVLIDLIIDGDSPISRRGIIMARDNFKIIIY